MANLTVLLLGSPHLQNDSGSIDFDRRKGVALLAYLAVEEGRHTREKLATLLWPDYERKKSLAYLRRALWSISQGLPEGILSVERDSVGFAADAGIHCDVIEFREHLKQWQQHHQDGAVPCPACTSKLQLAVDIYRGDFLTGFTLEDSSEFDAWQSNETENLHYLFTQALEQLVLAYGSRGELNQAILHGQRWLAIDPLHEAGHRILMHLYVASSRPQNALQQYESCTAVLDNELGIPPEEETTRLYEAILDRLELPASPIFIGAKASLSPPPKKHNLPASLTSFIGRAAELKQIETHLQDENCRLLTLVGHGGIGKTTLSIHVGHLLLPKYEGGTYFVPLAALDATDSIISAIAEAIGLQFQGQADLTAQLLTFLQGRQCLLILDNFEHLLAQSALVVELLSSAADLDILVTSRERLNLPAEWALEVGGLTHPEGIDVESFDAVQLFLERAKQAQSGIRFSDGDLQIIAEICRFLAGIPLAIELAAAWVRIFSVAEIREELAQNLDILTSRQRNAPFRHQSLHHVFNQSWQLLTPEEQRLFRHLSIFRGSFDLNAARQAADGSPTLLLNLVDKSLLSKTNSGRFRLSAVLRQFAAEKMAEFPQEAENAGNRHSLYFAQFIADRKAGLYGANPAKAVRELENELSNLRKGWRWALSHLRLVDLEESVDTLSEFLELRGLYSEAKQLFTLAIEGLNAGRSNEKQRLYVLAKIKSNLGQQYRRLGDLTTARQVYQQSLKTFQSLNEPFDEAVCLSGLGYLDFQEGFFDKAQSRLETGLKILREHNDEVHLARTANRLGIVMAVKGKYQEGQQLFEQSMAYAQRSGFARYLAISAHSLGNLQFLIGDFAASKQYFEQALASSEEIGDRSGAGSILMSMAEMTLGHGEYVDARQQFQQSLERQQQLGDKKRIAQSLIGLGRANCELGEYDIAQANLVEAIEIGMAVRATPIVIEALVGLAGVNAGINQPQKAAKLLYLTLNHKASMEEVTERAQLLLQDISLKLNEQELHQAEQWAKQNSLETALDQFLFFTPNMIGIIGKL